MTPHTAHRTPLLILFLLSFPFWAFAQLIQEKNPSEVTLTTSEQQFVQKMTQLVDTKTTKYISLGDVSQYETNGLLSFSLPGVSGTLQSEAVHVEYTNSTDYIWSAKLTNQPGYVSFIVTPGAKVGFVQMQGKFFSICPINGTVSLLRELDLSKIPHEDCALALGEAEPPPAEFGFCEPANSNCFSEIDLLILISTPDVQQWFQGFFDPFVALATILQGIESINLAFANSGIPNKHIRWRMETFEFGGYDTQLDIADDVEDLAIEASVLREQRQADAVIMLTARDYPGFFGVSTGPNTCGAPLFNCAYAIVEIGSIADPRWTFAHEFAHLLGARHNRTSVCSNANHCGDDDNSPCAHAWIFEDQDGVQQRTILARLSVAEQSVGTARILHYSNPDVEFNGTPTGDEANNNARIIRNAACSMDDYYHADWTVGIEGPNEWCPPSIALDAISIPPTAGWGNNVGLPPYQFEWQRGCGPVGPWTFISNLPSITISNPYCQPTFWVQLKVTSSDGLIRIVKQKIYACGQQARGAAGSSRNVSESSTQNMTTLSPNPANDAFNISFSNAVVSAATVHITNSTGQLVKNFSTSNDQEITVSTTDWPAGTYFVSIATDATTETHKLLINKH